MASAIFVPSASAGVTGGLTFSACSGGGVAVNFATIDFQNPVLLGYGCMDTGTPTALTYNDTATTTATIGPGVAGTVNDLGYPPPGSGNLGFITLPGVFLDLTAIGPGVLSTSCSATLNPNNPACSVFSGSPF